MRQSTYRRAGARDPRGFRSEWADLTDMFMNNPGSGLLQAALKGCATGF
jgi:hypothetical protein